MAANDGGSRGATPSVQSAAGPDSSYTSGYLNIPGPFRAALAAAGMAPGIPGIVGTAVDVASRVPNLLNTNRIRGELGLPNTDIGQAAGALTGLNDYASRNGNQTIAAPGAWTNPLNGQSPAITAGGLYDNGNPIAQAFAGLMGLFGGSGYADPSGAMTPQEAMHRVAYASLPPGFFSQPKPATPAAPTTNPSMLGAVPSAPAASNPMSAAALRTPVYRTDGTFVGYVGDPAADNAVAAGLAAPSTGSALSNNGSYASPNAGQSGNSFGNYGGSYGAGDTTAVGASGQLGHI